MCDAFLQCQVPRGSDHDVMMWKMTEHIAMDDMNHDDDDDDDAAAAAAAGGGDAAAADGGD